MWAALKKAVTGVTESLGIEIPGLPVDLGALGDTVAGVTQGVSDTATGALDGLTAAGDQVSGAATGALDGLTTAGDQVSGAAADITNTVSDASTN